MNKHNFHTILLLFSNLQAAHKLVVVKETDKEENTIGSPTCWLGLANYDPWAKSSLLPVQINKCYWNTATFTHLHIALTIFLHYSSRAELPWQRSSGPQSQKFLLFDPLQTPTLNQNEFTEESQNVLKRNVSTPWPKLKRRVQGVFFNGEKTVCPWGDNLSLQPCSRHHNSGNTFSYNLKGISPSLVSQKQQLLTPLSLLPELPVNVEREKEIAWDTGVL